MTASAGEGKYIVEHPTGAVVFRQGERGSHMYVVRSGKVEITRNVGGREATVAVVLPGDFFGEMALIDKAPRSGTARVVERARLLTIDANTFDVMIHSSAEIAARMVQRLAQRLADATRQIELLLLRDPHARVVHCLRQDAEQAGPADASGRVRTGATEHTLGERTGMTAAEVVAILQRLVRSGLVQLDPQGVVVTDVGKLKDYVDFLEMKNRVSKDGAP